MQYASSIEKSKILYENAKAFFVSKNLPDCVIEISDKPFEGWAVHLTPTDEEMFKKRSELCDSDKPFISLYKADDGNHFFFRDKSMVFLQIIETGEILAFRDRGLDNYELGEVQKEFQELKKMLQGA